MMWVFWFVISFFIISVTGGIIFKILHIKKNEGGL